MIIIFCFAVNPVEEFLQWSTSLYEQDEGTHRTITHYTSWLGISESRAHVYAAKETLVKVPFVLGRKYRLIPVY